MGLTPAPQRRLRRLLESIVRAALMARSAIMDVVDGLEAAIRETADRWAEQLAPAGWTIEVVDRTAARGTVAYKVVLSHALRGHEKSYSVSETTDLQRSVDFINRGLGDINDRCVAERNPPGRPEMYSLLAGLRESADFVMWGPGTTAAVLHAGFVLYEHQILTWQEVVWLENALWQDSQEPHHQRPPDRITPVPWSPRIGMFVPTVDGEPGAEVAPP
jgi:hypothetical protein